MKPPFKFIKKRINKKNKFMIEQQKASKLHHAKFGLI